ncbi:hypothetical protein RJT34_11582 [Clitoria ternatea]|uniref:Uncharacterized protein n=1 Tax=Clitoria ternatea TaxID=43366 RepID=A0AAN9JMX2_CLITE
MILFFLHETLKSDGVMHLCLEARPTDKSSCLHCPSNPKILIHGGVLQVGSDPISTVKLLPDSAHVPLKLECLSFIKEAMRGIDKFEVRCGMRLVMDGGYEISSASNDEPV